MLKIRSPKLQGRRAVLQAGALGLTGLNLATQKRLIAEGTAKRNNKSVILIWLDGGPSQLESYDPKPEAPAEFRGPFGTIQTSLSGVHFSELLSQQAKFADKMSIIRSMRHGTGDHFAGAHWMLTGRFGATTASKGIRYPSLGSCVSKLKGANKPGLPAYVGLPSAESVYLYPGYQGAAYLGGEHDPFAVNNDIRYLHHTYKTKVEAPTCFKSATGLDQSRAQDRSHLMASLDRLRRDAVAAPVPAGATLGDGASDAVCGSGPDRRVRDGLRIPSAPEQRGEHDHQDQQWCTKQKATRTSGGGSHHDSMMRRAETYVNGRVALPMRKAPASGRGLQRGAAEGTRTLDLLHGKQTL